MPSDESVRINIIVFDNITQNKLIHLSALGHIMQIILANTLADLLFQTMIY
jgi:hypothetical protein